MTAQASCDGLRLPPARDSLSSRQSAGSVCFGNCVDLRRAVGPLSVTLPFLAGQRGRAPTVSAKG